MPLTKEDLLAHSRCIRDTLAPRISGGENLASEKHAFDLSHLQLALEELRNTPMTIEVLRFCRMEKALQKITKAREGGWPRDIVSNAKELLAKWEESLGPLNRVRSDLWAVGGRLEKLKKPVSWAHGFGAIDGKPEGLTWSVEVKPSAKAIHKEGHLRFKIGDWWLNTAAAYRDGIIDDPQYRITGDADVAYAIVLTANEESGPFKDDSFIYRPILGEPNAIKLMATINGTSRTAVRVLRCWTWNSRLAPRGGVRYDGLYRVAGYGVRLQHQYSTINDDWYYSFQLQREPGQDSIEMALSHPNPDQLDDWDDYCAEKDLVTEQDFMVFNFDGAGLSKDRIASIDSGYFSNSAPNTG